MESNQNFGDLLNTSKTGSIPAPSGGGGGFGDLLTERERKAAQPVKEYKPVDTESLRGLAAQEGAEHLLPVIGAIYGQESGGGANAVTSVDGARGGMQITPDTFRRYAKSGEDINNADDNMRVGIRIIKSLGDKFGNDPAKIATGYFSGDGNVNPGQGSAWKNDAADGNGKRVSSYVSDVLGRVGAAPAQQTSTGADLGKAPKWADVEAKAEYAALSAEDKAKTKAAYFDYWIAPHAGAQKDALRQRFLANNGQNVPTTDDTVDTLTPPRQSVMEGQPGPQALPTDSKVPVRPEVLAEFNAKWDAATPDQRKAMGKIPGWVGQLARSRSGQYEAFDASNPGKTMLGMDTRAESRAGRLAAAGEDPRFAARIGQDAAAAGVAPGNEIAFAQRRGVAQNSTFDFDTKQAFDPNAPNTGLNNALTRGLAKGGLGMGKAITGYGEFLSDVMGLDEANKSMREKSEFLRGKEDAIGSHGTMLERNLEGAIGSIIQQLPLMIAGAKTGAEAIPLAGMAVQTFGQEYSDGRAKGQSIGEATTRAGIFAAFEVIGEKFGLGDTLKAYRAAAQGLPSDQIIKFLWSALKKEIPGEVLTTTGQFATDKFMPKGVALNPNATFEDYLKQVGDTIVQTIMQSGIQGAGTTGVGKAVEFLNQAHMPEDQFARALSGDIKSRQFTREGINEQVIRSMNPNNAITMPPPGGATQIPGRPTVTPAEEAGAPAINAPTTGAVNTPPPTETHSDQDVRDFAETRIEALQAKQAGEGDDQHATGTLTPTEQDELRQLEAAGDDVAKLRQMYGFDQTQPENSNETQQQDQTNGPALGQGAGSDTGQTAGIGQESGAGTGGAEVGAPAGQRYEGLSAQDALDPKAVLREIGRLSDEAFGGNHPSVPSISLADGTFAGSGTLNMDGNGNVVLTRVADNEDHLGKSWRQIGREELMSTSMWHGGGRGIPTSGMSGWDQSFGTTSRPDRVVGTFTIPVQDLIQAIRDGNAVLGNVGEGEIVLNPSFAKRYLSHLNGKTVTETNEQDSDIPDIGAPSNVSEEEAMRSMGFSEQEIADLLGNRNAPQAPEAPVPAVQEEARQGTGVPETDYGTLNLGQFQEQHSDPYRVPAGVLTTDLTKLTDEQVHERFGRDDLVTLAKLLNTNVSGSKADLLANIRKVQDNRSRMRNVTREQLDAMTVPELRQLVTSLGEDSRYKPKDALVDIAANWRDKSIQHTRDMVAESNHVRHVVRSVINGNQDVSDENIRRYGEELWNAVDPAKHPELYQKLLKNRATRLFVPPLDDVPSTIARLREEAQRVKDDLKAQKLDDLADALEALDNKRKAELAPPKTEKEAKERKQPDPTGGTPEEGAGGTQPPQAAPQTEAEAKKAKAQADLDAALGELGDILGKGTRMNIVPEEEHKLLPVLTKVMDAAFRLGYYKFKDAARFVLSTIREKLGKDAADQITLDHLQGAYIGMAGKYQSEGTASSKKDVVAVESLAELEQEDKPTETEPVATAIDLQYPEGRYKVAKALADDFIGGASFASIIEARKRIGELIGKKIDPGTELAKLADETIEAAVVIAARDMVEAGRKQGRSAQVIYDRLLALYNAQPNLSVRSSTSVREQAYSTPVPLAFVASELAGINNKTKVLEPTAGNGMLLIGAGIKNAVVNELNLARAAMLRQMGFDPTHKNAATENVRHSGYPVDAVIANPPFGVVKNDSGDTIVYRAEVSSTAFYQTSEIDHAIAFKALASMKDDGRAVLIVGGSNATSEEGRRGDYRGKNKRAFYFNLYQNYNVVDHFTVDGSLYAKQGASYPVDVIVIEGRGKSSRDLPAADLPKVIGSYDELKEKLNGTRSVGTEGDGSTAGTDSGTDQPGASDGAGVDRSPSGSGAGTGEQSGRSGNDASVPESGRTGTGGNRGSGTGTGTQQPQSTDKPQSGNAGEASVPGDSGRAGTGTQGRTGAGTERLGGTSVVAGERVESGLNDRRGEEQETSGQVAYAPHSQAASVGTLVPRAMAGAIEASLQKIEDTLGNLDEYVADRLGMDIETVRTNFSAEQVDALALAIKNAEEGRGFIIGDQTGIGKGRVVAAMIKYAIVNDKTPIFVTEKPNLYSDMIRDLDDIGMTDELGLDTAKPKILITNGSESIPYTLLRTVNGEVTENNLTLKAPKSGEPLNKLFRDMMEGESLGDYKVIFTTYSQLQTVKGKVTDRMKFVQQFGSSNFMIFDESHNAGGAGPQRNKARSSEQREAEGSADQTGRAAFVRGLVDRAFGTFFSSATYAKRPDVMDLYSSTNMKLAVDKLSQLAEAIKTGGVPMQQVVANMLTTDGQYIRRERTFAGVSYDTVETAVDKQTAENMAKAMRRVLAFSRAKEKAVKEIQSEMDKEGAMVKEMGGEKATIQGSNFGSVMHNLIDQMLLSLKVQDSVRHAIERLKAGEKVVMTVSNTMGSFLQTYAEEMGLNVGDPVALTFADLYQRYLEKQRWVTIKDARGQKNQRRLTDQELGPGLVNMFNEIGQEIANSGFGSAPISPIDYMHNELRKAGYKTDEITGRTITLNYSEVGVGEAREETKFSFKTLEQGEQKTEWYSAYANAKPYQMQGNDFDVGKVIADDNSGSNRAVIVGRVKESKEKNGNLYFVAKNLKTGELFVSSPPMSFPTGETAEVDKNYQSELDGFSKARGASSAGPKITSRSANIRQRVNAVRGFNNGDIDVIILNQAGSTGLSLHASSKVKDKKKRHMIIVQAEKNIDTHMQMLGRVHRTGQVIAPAYSQMMADVPAEMRPAAVLLKKMASLNANTTASRKSSVTAEGVVDFMNDYGGQVVQEYLRDNPDVLEAIGGNKIISLVEDSSEATEDDIRKFTGYVPILPIKQQEEIYKDLIDRYNELLERENTMGTNKLEAKAVDLDAETLNTRQITEDKGDPSIFAAPANMEQVNVKRTVKPYSSKEVNGLIEESLDGKSAHQIARENIEDLRDRMIPWAKERIAKMEAQPNADHLQIEAQKNLLNMILGNTKAALETYQIGMSVSIKDKLGMIVYGVITDIKPAKRTANPAAGSDWKMTIALANGDAKSLNLTFSQLGTKYQLAREDQINWFNPETQQLEYISVLAVFDKGTTARREKRWMVTGNILAGYAKFPGQIITYTRKDGTTGQGVLMNRQFDFDKEMKNQPVGIKTGAEVVKFLDNFKGTVGTEDGVLRITKQSNRYNFIVPSSKKEGGTYFLDKQFTDVLQGDFYKRGSVMVASMFYGEDAAKAIDYLITGRQETLVALTHQEQAREMLGQNKPQVLNDLKVSPSYAFAGLPDSVRVNARGKLNSLERKLDAGKITEAEYVFGVREITRMLNDQADDRKIAEVERGRRRGADWVVAQLMRGVADGLVPRNQAEFAKWLLDQNPHLANDLGYSISVKSDLTSRGNYNPISRVMKLFAANLDENGNTAVHEILHHVEQMMPHMVQGGVLREWQRQWDATYRKATPATKAAMRAMLEASMGNQEATKAVAKAFNDGTLTYDQHYQLYSPSEFWAVNATRIVSGRYEARGSWVSRAVQWLKEFYQHVKGFLGLSSDAPVLRALKAVIQGEGDLNNGMLVNMDYSQWMGEKGTEQKAEVPNPQDIMAKIKRDAAQFFGNSQSLRTFGWYDRSIATQFHKALKDNDYGKVFGYINAMQNEVSLTSIRPAELAPGILRKVDDFKSAVSTLTLGQRTHKSMQGAASALFAGTLQGATVMEGRVWTTDELRNNFGLDDAGVALYEQARAAIDASLDEVAAAEAFALCQGYVPKQARRQIIENPQHANRVLFGALSKGKKMLQTTLDAAIKSKASQERIDYLTASIAAYTDTEERLKALFGKSRDLKKAGYAPLMRFGPYSLTVQRIDPATGTLAKDPDGKSITEYYRQFETEAEAKKAEERLRIKYAGDDTIRITPGVKSNLTHELYQGLSPETLALFADEVGVDQVMKEFYKNALTERSALKRKLERKGTAGYSEDLPRILANFVTSNGRFAAQRYYMRDLNNAIKYIPNAKGDVRDEAIKLRKFMMNPNDSGAVLSSVMFAHFLGGSVAAAAMNLTQTVTMTGPYLSQFGVGTASVAMAKAVPVAMGQVQITDKDLAKALQRASREGIVEAQEIFHLYSQGAQGVSRQLANLASRVPVVGEKLKQGTEGLRARGEAFLTLWGMMFSVAEKFNRKVAFIAAWNVAIANNERNPYAFAVRAVNETQGIYNKANRPNLARPWGGRAVFTFKQYSIMYIEMQRRMWRDGGAEGKRAVALSLATLILLSGAVGAPFADDIMDLIDTIGQLFFKSDTNMKRNMRRWAHEKFGETWGDLALYGVSAKLPLDFSGRMGMGNLIPGTGALKVSEEGNLTRDLAEAGGPAGSMVESIFKAKEAYSEGNTRKALENLSPKAIKDLMAAADMASTGTAKDSKGRKNMDVTLADAAIKAVGFNPTKIADASRSRAPGMQDAALQKQMESSIVDMWARGIATQDDALSKKAAQRLEDWNKRNPDTPVKINSDQIRSAARQYLTDQNTRILKSTPRELRGRVGLDIAK